MPFSALDVAKYIIAYEHSKQRQVSNLRLQKLLYFVQAKAILETDELCFSDEMQAWDFGPVVPKVYHAYKIFGSWDIKAGDTEQKFDEVTESYTRDILDYCSSYPTFQLVEITHKQAPWKNAYRKGFKNTITEQALKEYFKKSER